MLLYNYKLKCVVVQKTLHTLSTGSQYEWFAMISFMLRLLNRELNQFVHRFILVEASHSTAKLWKRQFLTSSLINLSRF